MLYRCHPWPARFTPLDLRGSTQAPCPTAGDPLDVRLLHMGFGGLGAGCGAARLSCMAVYSKLDPPFPVVLLAGEGIEVWEGEHHRSLDRANVRPGVDPCLSLSSLPRET
jgi:hypothetical protein